MASGGDIEVLFTADDRDVSAGMDRLARKAGGFAGEMAKAGDKVKEQFTGFKNLGPAAAGAVAAGFGLATKAVMDYVGKNDIALGQLNSLKRASAEVWTAIGRDISAGGIGQVVELIQQVDKLRQKAVDGLSWIMGGDPKGVGEAMKATENMIKAAAEQKTLKTEGLRLEEQIAAAAGDSVKAAQIKAQLEKEAALERLNSLNVTNSPEKERLKQLIEDKTSGDVAAAKKAANDEMQKLMDAEWEKTLQGEQQDKREREKLDQQKQQRDEALERFAIDMQAAELDAKRSGMKKEEIVRAEKELELRRKILEINGNDVLLQGDKAAAIEKLRALSEVEVGLALGKKGDEKQWRSLESSGNVSGATLAAAGATRNAGMTIAVTTRDATLRTAKAVERIAERGVAAVLQ